MSSEPFPRARTELSTATLMEQVEPRNAVKTVKILSRRPRDATRALILAYARSGTVSQQRVALDVLGSWADAALFDFALSLLENPAYSTLRHSAFRYLESQAADRLLSEVPTWIEAERPYRVLAYSVLERHASSQHVPLLLEKLRTAMLQGDHVTCASAVAALGTADDPVAIPDIERFYEVTEYAYGKHMAAAVLARLHRRREPS